MARIAKKPRSVKGQKQAKPSPPRYSIKKDSLGRRYATDKRTGRRVAMARAEKERKQRKKLIPRNIPVKAPKKSKARSIAAKKGWETRRQKKIVTPVPIAVTLGIPRPPESIIPEGMRLVPLEGIEERANRYPKVAAAAENAWNRLQAEAYVRLIAENEGRTPPPLTTRKFDLEHGQGAAEFIRYKLLARAHDLGDLDRIVAAIEDAAMTRTKDEAAASLREALEGEPDLEDLINELIDEYEDGYSARELYTLYFSPEVA